MVVSVGDTAIEPVRSTLPISGLMVQVSLLVEAHEDMEKKTNLIFKSKGYSFGYLLYKHEMPKCMFFDVTPLFLFSRNRHYTMVLWYRHCYSFM